MSGLTGQRSVSESGPGDRDFNGGRWAVKLAIFTDTGIYFECPLLPRRPQYPRSDAAGR